MKEKLLIIIPLFCVIAGSFYGLCFQGAPLPGASSPLLQLINVAKQWEISHISGLLPVIPLVIAGWGYRQRAQLQWRPGIILFSMILFLLALTLGRVGLSSWLFHYSDHVVLKMATACMMSSSLLLARGFGPLTFFNQLFVILYAASDFHQLSITAHTYHTALEIAIGMGVGSVVIVVAGLTARSLARRVAIP